MNEGVCRGCGRKIIWGETVVGVKVPLDPSAPVYEVPLVPDQPGAILKIVDGSVMVSHFSTCSQANKFSGSRKS